GAGQPASSTCHESDWITSATAMLRRSAFLLNSAPIGPLLWGQARVIRLCSLPLTTPLPESRLSCTEAIRTDTSSDSAQALGYQALAFPSVRLALGSSA